MRRMIMSAMALGLAVAPAALTAQVARPDAEARQARGGFGAPNPAARVLALRQELGLTAAQVSQLEQIQRRFEADTRPLLERLEAARPEGERGPVAGPLRRAGPGARGADVTPEQRAERREQMQARMQPPTPEQRAERREQMQARMQQLTPEQRAEMRERMGRRQGEARAGAEPLTPEQRAELRSQMERRRGELEAQRAELQPVLEQLRTTMAETHEAVRTVLTSEQEARLQELRPAQRGPGGMPGFRRGPGR